MGLNENLSVPLMRTCIEQISKKNRVNYLPAIIYFTLIISTDFLLFSVFHSKVLFLILIFLSLIVGLVFKYANETMAKKLSPMVQEQVFLHYQPIVSQLSSAEFFAAAENSKAIIKLSVSMMNSHPHIFAVVDNALNFFLSRFLSIIQAKNLIGDSREIKRQLSRLQDALNNHNSQLRNGQKVSNTEKENLDLQIAAVQSQLDKLEAINRSALMLSNELLSLRTNCETVVVEKLLGEEETRKSTLLLKEQLDREKRIAAELQSMGL